LRTLQIYIL